jgi:hypothetical protein
VQLKLSIHDVPRRGLFPWQFYFHKLGTSVICWSIHSQCSINHEDPLFSPMYEAALMRQHEIILEIHFRSSVMSVNVIWRVWFDPILWESESVHWRFFTECFYIFANNGCEETMQFYFYNIFLLTERFFNTNYFFPVFQNISWSRISSWSFRLCLTLSPTNKIETHFAERTVGGPVTGKIRVNPGRPWSLGS